VNHLLRERLGQSETPYDAILRACTLEATAPKAGNVHPGQSFDDLDYSDFLVAASIASESLSDPSQPIALRTFTAAQSTTQILQTNVNLGILLLLAPLVAADERMTQRRASDWQPAVAQVLQGFTQDDSASLLRAIQISLPGGLGTVDQMDVHDAAADQYDIVAAMTLAAQRDRIARQYAQDFVDFFDNVVPVVADAIASTEDLMEGIAQAHLVLLGRDIDTLIQRKCGLDVAADVQRRAAELDVRDAQSCQQFDDFLRSDGNRLNPGTTADLMAAALYVLLRSDD